MSLSDNANTGLRLRLAQGDCVLGTFVSTPSAEIVEMLAIAGWDFAIIDCEHGHFGVESIAGMLRAAELHGMAALVRVPHQAPHQIGKALDLGAAGIVVPGVDSVDSARQFLALTRYPPKGVRGAHLSTRHLRYSAVPFAAHASDDAARPLTVLQIEAALPAADIAEIAALPGLDVLFVGINDLANSMGLHGQFEHPAVQQVVDTIIEAARQRGLGLGRWAREPGNAGALAKRGFNFIAVSNNELMFYEAAAAQLRAGRSALGATGEAT